MLELSGREAEQRIRRSQRGAERDELLACWRSSNGGTATSSSSRRAPKAPSSTSTASTTSAPTRRSTGSRRAERACEIVRAAWRDAEELQLSAPLALEALLVRLQQELGGLVRGVAPPQVFRPFTSSLANRSPQVPVRAEGAS